MIAPWSGSAWAIAFGTPLPAWPVDHLRQMNWLTDAPPGSLPPAVRGLDTAILANLAGLGFGEDFTAEDAEAAGPRIEEQAVDLKFEISNL